MRKLFLTFLTFIFLQATATAAGTDVFDRYDSINSNFISPVITAHPINQALCIGSNAVFSVTATGTGLTYQWQVNTGSGFTDITSGSAGSITYSGFNTAQLTVSGAGAAAGGYQYRCVVNCTSCDAVTSNAATLAAPFSVQVTFNASLCTNKPFQYDASVSGTTSPYSYLWELADGTTDTHSGKSIGNPSTNLAGATRLTVTDRNGCKVVKDTTIQLEVVYSVAVTNNAPFCENGTIQYNATGAAGISYLWKDPTGVTVSSSSISRSATSAYAGTYTLTSSKNGCTSDKTFTASITTYPTATISGLSAAICTGYSATVSATTGSGLTYAWTGPNGFTASTSSFTLNNIGASNAGLYSVTVSNGCAATASATLTTKNSPVSSITGSSTLCANETLSLSAANAGAGASYSWVGPNAFSSTSSVVNISNATTSNGGTYILITNLNGCSSSAFTNITVNPLPVAQINGVNAVCETAAISLTATDAGVGATYAWSGPSSFTSNTNTASISSAALTNGGVYTLTSTLNGCTNTTSQTVTVKALPISQINGVNAVCENAAISLTAADAGVGATYAWSGPSSFTSNTNTANISSAALTNAGVYTLTSTLNGCTNTTSQTVTVKALPVAQINGVNTVCENAAISLTATDAGVGATYAWSGPSSFTSNTASASISSAALTNSGVYTLTSTLNGCTNTTTQTVTVKPLPVAQINGVNAVCENASISLTAADAGVGATYAWSGPSSFTSNTASASINSAALTNSGTYTLTSTLNGCTNTTSQTVIVKALPVAQINGVNAVCENAAISLTAADAGVDATYAWSGPSSFTSNTNTASISSAALTNGGTYTLISTLNGCTNTTTQTVTVKALPVAQINGVNAVCETAAISLAAADAGVGATYAWSGPSSFTSNTNTASISSAALTNGGVYTLTSTLNGCTNTTTQTVTVKALPVAQINGTNAVCENASISLTAADAGVGATYAWSGPSSFTSNTNTASISSAALTNSGTYTLTSTLNGCTNTTSQTVTVKALPVAQINGVNAVCESAAISLTAADAGVGATYAWSGPSSFTSNTANANIASAALTNSGTYTLTSTLNGCSSTTTQTVTVKALPVAQINGVNAVCENASISLTAADAGVGATYAWSGPSSFTSNTNTANIASAALTNSGTYTLTSTLNGCTNTTSQTVTVKALPVAQINGTNSVCENAAINLTAADAGVGATYTWSGPSSFTSTTNTASISSAALTNGGTYTLTSTLNGCSSTTTQTVTVKVLPVAQINGVNAVCENAAISLTATDAGVGATYAWSGPSSFTSTTNTASISSAVLTNGGTYTLTSTLNGCTNTATQTVTVKALPVAQINGVNAVCENAAISLTAADAGVGATYAWSGPSSFTSNTANANIASAALTNSGTYTLTSTLNGCTNTTTQTVTVKALPVAQINGVNAVCENAAISLNAADAGVGATYAWSGPSSFTSNTASASISSAALTNGGVYTLTSTLNGCTNTTSQTVTVKALPVAQINGVNAVCENAAISLTATDAGVGATYAWSGPSSFTSNTANANIASAALTNSGTYTLISTLNGCTNTTTQTVTVKALPVAQINGTNAVCENAAISLTAADAGVGATYAWSGPSSFTSNTANANIASAALTNSGTYTLTSTLNGCSSTTTQTVTVKALPVAQINGVNAVCENASISLTAADAGVGATYAWSGPSSFTSNTNTVSINSAALTNGGTYTLTSTLNGCTNTTTQILTVKPFPVAQINGVNAVCENASISLTAADAGVGATYAWSGPLSFTSTTNTASISSAALTNSGTYTLTSTLNGCTNTTSQTVTVKALPVAQINGVNAVCENASISLTAADAGVGATYAWSGPSSFTSNTNTASISSAALTNSGTYTLTSTLNGCTNTTTQTVTVKALPVAQINGVNPVCENAAISLTATDAGVGATYAWSGPSSFTSNTASASINSAALTNGGVYTLTSTLNGCTNTTTQTVTVKALPVAQINGVSAVCENAAISLTAADAGVDATYAWSGPSSFTSNTNTANIASAALTNAGVYTLTSTLNGCTNTTSQTVTVKALPVAQITGITTVCESAPLNLTAANATAGATYSWLTGGNSVAQNTSLNILQTQLSNAGNYILQAEKDGCISTMNFTVTVKPLVKAIINGANTVCEKSNIELSVADQGAGVSYLWNGPSGFTATTTSIAVKHVGAEHAGTYFVTMVRDGCQSTSSIEVVVKEKPKVNFSGKTELCEGETLSLVAADAGEGAQYVWEDNKGNSYTGSTYIKTAYSLDDPKNIFLTVTKNGCTNKMQISVLTKALPAAAIVGVQSFCEGDNIALDAKDAGNGAEYIWETPGNGTDKTKVLHLNKINNSQAGDYVLTVQKDGCANKAVANLKVKKLPVVKFSGETNVCENSPVVIAVKDQTPNTSYVWNGPMNFSAASSSVQFEKITAANAGHYTVTLTRDGCSVTDSVKLKVKSLPAAVITGDASVCANTNIKLEAEDAGADAQYVWSGPSNFSGAGRSISLSNATAVNEGSYQLTVIRAGCVNSSFKTVLVKPLPVVAYAGELSVCENSSLNIKAADAGANAVYTWKDATGNDIAGALVIKAKATPQDNGVYKLYVTVNNCTSVAEAHVKIKALPLAEIKGVTEVCEKSTLELNAPKEASVNYQWRAHGSLISSAENISVSNIELNKAGVYELIAERNGCVNSAKATVKVKALPVIKLVGDKIVCERSDIKLTAHDDASYVWKQNGIVVSSANVLEIKNASAKSAGMYTIEAVKAACSVSEQFTLAVKTVKAKISSANILCENDELKLKAEDAGDNAKYIWSGPSFSGKKQNEILSEVKPKHAGNYTLTVEKDGCTNSDVVNISVKAAPVANISGTNAVCENAPVQLKASESANATYTWQQPDGSVIKNSVLAIEKANLKHSGEFKLIVNEDGCVATASTTLKVKPLPNAKIAGDEVVCEGLSLQFLASNAGDDAVYTWSLPGDKEVSGTSLKIAPIQLTNTGLYKLNVTIDGCTSSTQKYLKVTPKPDALVYGATEICETSSLKLEAGDAGENATYQWTAPNGEVIADKVVSVKNIGLNQKGGYTLSVSKNGCTVNTTANVTVNKMPQASIKITNAVCEGETLLLQAASSDNVQAYEWSGPTIVSTVAPSITINNAQAKHTGTYSLIARMNGCETTTTQFVKVKALPRPIIKGNNNLCEGNALHLSGADAQTVGDFTWMTPDNKIINGQTLTLSNISASNAGLYRLKVIHDGCTSLDSLSVKVNKNPIVNLQPVPDVCQFTPALFVKANELAGLKGSGIFSGSVVSATGEISTMKTGAYTINYSFTTDAGCTASANGTVKINPGISVNAGSDLTQYEDEGVQLNAMVSGTYKQLTWSNVSSANTINPLVKPSETTTYTVFVVNEYGCTAKDDVTVKVVRMKIPNAFSPNNDGMNDRWEPESLKNFTSCRLEIFNRSGQSVFMRTGNGISWDGKINGQPAPEGTYYYVINVNDGKQRKPLSGYLQVLR
jgi:gliding motility-associated-like protein